MFGTSKARRTPERLHVLIVDDEESVRRFVERVMREAGHETGMASDGAEALKMAPTFGRIDLLLTDVNMPEMVGHELAKRVRATQPEVKVLYLTGYADLLFKEKMTLSSGEAFLDKPCSVKGLLEAVSLLAYGSLKDRPLAGSVR